MQHFDPIALGILWDRLISITDEIVEALVRTSFSTNVRDSYDLSCVIFDAAGNSLAQGSYSVPSFTGTAPATLRHMLDRFPPESLQEGDVIVTNDPWLGTGHLFDISVMRPVYRNKRLIGYTMSITHLPDVGGQGFSAAATEVFEEGLRLPICKLVDRGRVDRVLMDIIGMNVRVPEQTLGDIMANVSCNEVGGRMLLEFMEEYRLDDLAGLSAGIINSSESAIRAELNKLPNGRYENDIVIEGWDEPIRLACSLVVGDGNVVVDFAGTDGIVKNAINVPLCYSRAMACYAIKCLTTPRVPNNVGSVRPVEVMAPPNCILNALPPAVTGGRHIVGHFVVPLIFAAVAEILPDRVQADSGMLNLMNVQGRHRDGRGVSSIFFAAGGFGALNGADGAPTTPSPSNMTGTPIEIWENLTSMFIERKHLLVDSGGPGKYRGGLGQEIVLRNETGNELTVSCLAGRDKFPPAGVLGGSPGAVRKIMINGSKVNPKGRYVLQPGDVLIAQEAGGGGYGDPRSRPGEFVEADLTEGFVSAQAARDHYGYSE